MPIFLYNRRVYTGTATRQHRFKHMQREVPNPMPKQPTPQWQPIAQLARIAAHIDGWVADVATQYETLREARPKPYVLDDHTVGRVIQVYTTQQKDLGLFDEQLRRWETGTLTAAQRAEVDRLKGQMRRLHELIAAILSLAEELKAGTIEAQLAKSDLQLGIEALRKRQPPNKMN